MEAEANRGNGKEGVCHSNRCGVKGSGKVPASLVLSDLQHVD